MDIIVPSIKQVADWGPEQPYVARIEVGLSHLIENLRSGSDDLDEVMRHFQLIGEELSNAFISLRRIQNEELMLYESRKEYANLYGHLWAAYQDRMLKFMKAFGYDVGFIFQKEGKLVSRASEYAKEQGLPEEFATQIVHDRNNWHMRLKTIRDDHNEHRKLNQDIADRYFNKAAAQVIFDNVWQAIEDIVASHIKAEYEKKSKSLTLYEIPEENRDKQVAERFRVGLTPSALKNLPKLNPNPKLKK